MGRNGRFEERCFLLDAPAGLMVVLTALAVRIAADIEAKSMVQNQTGLWAQQADGVQCPRRREGGGGGGERGAKGKWGVGGVLPSPLLLCLFRLFL
jgi:hypothetical protein